MSETIVLEVKNRSELEELAHSRGYDTVQEYLLALVEADLQDVEDDLTPAEHFREGWREALAGHEGIPYDEMWEGIEDDTEG